MTIIEEIEAADLSELHKRTPYAITGVQHTQLSVARHYGGISYNGESYTYVPAEDVLVRADVVKYLAKKRKAKEKAKPTTWLDLLGDA